MSDTMRVVLLLMSLTGSVLGIVQVTTARSNRSRAFWCVILIGQVFLVGYWVGRLSS
jgi:hypothetical protein